jgi:hypothetical protein
LKNLKPPYRHWDPSALTFSFGWWEIRDGDGRFLGLLDRYQDVEAHLPKLAASRLYYLVRRYPAEAALVEAGTDAQVMAIWQVVKAQSGRVYRTSVRRLPRPSPRQEKGGAS